MRDRIRRIRSTIYELQEFQHKLFSKNNDHLDKQGLRDIKLVLSNLYTWIYKAHDYIKSESKNEKEEAKIREEAEKLEFLAREILSEQENWAEDEDR